MSPCGEWQWGQRWRLHTDFPSPRLIWPEPLQSVQLSNSRGQLWVLIRHHSTKRAVICPHRNRCIFQTHICLPLSEFFCWRSHLWTYKCLIYWHGISQNVTAIEGNYLVVKYIWQWALASGIHFSLLLPRSRWLERWLEWCCKVAANIWCHLPYS